MGVFQTAEVDWLGLARPNCSAIIVLMLMMSAELQRHPCDLIKPNLGQSILAAAEHLNIIITLLQPNLCAHLGSSESPQTSRARPQTAARHLSCHKPVLLSDTGSHILEFWF